MSSKKLSAFRRRSNSWLKTMKYYLRNSLKSTLALVDKDEEIRRSIKCLEEYMYSFETYTYELEKLIKQSSADKQLPNSASGFKDSVESITSGMQSKDETVSKAEDSGVQEKEGKKVNEQKQTEEEKIKLVMSFKKGDIILVEDEDTTHVGFFFSDLIFDVPKYISVSFAKDSKVSCIHYLLSKVRNIKRLKNEQ